MFKNLREHQIYAKFRKCKFYKDKLHYLSHAISKERLVVHPEKVRAIVNWPIGKDMFVVHSFMGITRHRGIFIEGFSKLVYPVTSIQKKGAQFEWTTKF